MWEPVLLRDIAPPTTAVLGKLSDARIEQFWDRDRLLSDTLLAMARAHPERLAPHDVSRLAKGTVLWDLIALFAKGARWETEPPFPGYYGGPVLSVLNEVRSRLEDPAFALGDGFLRFSRSTRRTPEAPILGKSTTEERITCDDPFSG